MITRELDGHAVVHAIKNTIEILKFSPLTLRLGEIMQSPYATLYNFMLIHITARYDRCIPIPQYAGRFL